MKTREIAEEYRLHHWSNIMRERQESGLSIRAFCKKAGFHENRYYYWQKRLREVTCESLSVITSESAEIMPISFVEAKLSERQLQKSQAAETTSHVSIEVDGIRISVSGDYSADKLAVLLREMKRPC